MEQEIKVRVKSIKRLARQLKSSELELLNLRKIAAETRELMAFLIDQNNKKKQELTLLWEVMK